MEIFTKGSLAYHIKEYPAESGVCVSCYQEEFYCQLFKTICDVRPPLLFSSSIRTNEFHLKMCLSISFPSKYSVLSLVCFSLIL